MIFQDKRIELNWGILGACGKTLDKIPARNFRTGRNISMLLAAAGINAENARRFTAHVILQQKERASYI
jgi:hypothetical protein